MQREDIELNTWYKVKDLQLIIGGMGKAKIRALLADKAPVINKGLLLPNLVKTATGWQITGRGLLTLLDIIGAGTPAEKENKKMAKKTFANNPAMKYLEADTAEQEQEKKQDASLADAEQEQAGDASLIGAVLQQAEQEAEKPAGQLLNFVKGKELRTARLQLVLPPSLLAQVKAYAKSRGISVNDFVCQLLQGVFDNQ